MDKNMMDENTKIYVCEIQISYAIGMKEPISICVNTFGTSKKNRR